MTPSTLQSGRENQLVAHIDRVISALAEEDISTNGQELIIRNAKELILIRAYRARKLAQRQARIESRLIEDDAANDAQGASNRSSSEGKK
jgi:hypothetical protein